MSSSPRPHAPQPGAASSADRFSHLPASPDLDRAVGEKETRPDATADAVAQAEFVERAGG